MEDNGPCIILVRHEESLANQALAATTDDDITYGVSGADLSIGLTVRGAQRSSELGSLLYQKFGKDNPIGAAWASQYLRTVQTRDGIVSAIPYSIETSTDSRINKRSYGLFWNLTYKGVEKLHLEEHLRFKEQGPLLYRPPEGENYHDLFARTDSFAESTFEPATGNILVVTHLVVLLAFMRRLENLSDVDVVRMYDNFAIPNGEIVVYRRVAAKWQRVRW